MALELTWLRHFLVVAEELSISRAAIRLHLAQPALSRQIARLEAELGVRVLLRSVRGVQLTAAGEALVEHARRTLAEADAAVAATRQAAARSTTPVRVAFFCNLAGTLMPELVARHRARCPDSAVEVTQLDFPTQLRRLRAGQLDAAFVRPFCDVEGLGRQTLLVEPVAVAVPSDHRLAGAASVPLDALADEQWILLAGSVVGYDAHARSRSRLRSAGVRREVLSASSVQAGTALAAAGFGVFPCPASTADTSPPNVAFVPIERWTTGVEMVWRPDRPDPAVQSFLQTARSRPGGDRPR